MPARTTTVAVARGTLMLLVLSVGLAACMGHRAGPAERQPWPWRERREDYLRRSTVWIGGDPDAWIRHMRGLDLRTGPSSDGAFAPDALVRCAFVPPHDANTFSGNTPKFLCRRGSRDDVFKVKWGEENGEVYADVVGTRLLWALGFPADRVYPVRIECTGCADDPWRDPAPHPGHIPALFTPASAERQFAGETIEETPHQGWRWSELGRVDSGAGGAPRADTDALRLLAAFIQHRDSKPDNQRLVCPPPAVVVEPGGTRNCRQPVMMIDDLGSAFGGPSLLLATHKMQLDAWRGRPVWKDPVRCIADVTTERARDGLDLPHIGEDGRRLLARLLAGLDRSQVTALFEMGRAGERGDVSAWVAVFEERRREIEHPVPSDPGFRCPAVGAEAMP